MKEKKQNEELQSRREFFKDAAKKALPVIGAIVLASSPIISQAASTVSMGCEGNCSGTCTGKCEGLCAESGCKGSCSGTCTGKCETMCAENGCKGSCSGICSGGCKSSSE
ncbi:MAG: Cys-Xaa-Xaa-Xaa repeat radical SAM target protein [Bacteroidales bacterium]|nr:Cys-Xaa-Xaa-Xaa repeat radical SAM target protein [Bacteroidales bacterium]